jgi:hypothetical protein
VNDPDPEKQDPEKWNLRECKTNFVPALVKQLNIPINTGSHQNVGAHRWQ